MTFLQHAQTHFALTTGSEQTVQISEQCMRTVVLHDPQVEDNS